MQIFPRLSLWICTLLTLIESGTDLALNLYQLKCYRQSPTTIKGSKILAYSLTFPVKSTVSSAISECGWLSLRDVSDRNELDDEKIDDSAERVESIDPLPLFLEPLLRRSVFGGDNGSM